MTTSSPLQEAMRRGPSRERLASIGMALMLAFVVWLSSISRALPINEVTLPRPSSETRITVEFLDLAEGLDWYSPEQRSVKVTLRGIESQLAAMQAQDIVATMSLAPVGEDDARFEGQVVARCREPLRCLRQGVRVVEVKPDTLQVMIGKRITRTLGIEVESDSDPPPGYTLVRRLAMPEQARVVGPAPQVERVHHLSVTVAGVSRLTRRTLKEGLTVGAFDEFGRELLDLVIDPSAIDVDLSIIKRDEPIFVFAAPFGSPAEGYRVVGIEVEPERVELSGARELIDPLRAGLTANVDITGLTEDLITRLPLDLPVGVEAVNAADGVTVTVRVSALQGTRSIEVPVQILNAPEGYTVDSSPTRVRILVGGAQPVLDALEESEIEALLDLDGMTSGSRRVAPSLRLPNGVSKISITPAEIDVSLTRTSGASAPLPSSSGTQEITRSPSPAP